MLHCENKCFVGKQRIRLKKKDYFTWKYIGNDAKLLSRCVYIYM